MNSIIFLRIKDPQIRSGYEAHRKRQINIASCFILVLRIVRLIYRVFGYDNVKECVLSYQFILTGIGLHLVALLLSLKWTWAAKIHSVLVILSQLSFQFCNRDNFTEADRVAFLIDTLPSDYMSSIFLSMIWPLTALAQLTSKGMLYHFYTNVLDVDYESLLYPMALSWTIQTFIIYISEKVYKELYLQNKNNENLQAQFKLVLEQLPDGVLIFGKDSKELLLSNEEFKQMIPSKATIPNWQKDTFERNIFEEYTFQDNNINSGGTSQENQFELDSVANKVSLSTILENYKEGQCYILHNYAGETSSFMIQADELVEPDPEKQKVVTITKSNLNFLSQDAFLLVFKNLTETVKYQKAQIENKFYALLTATVSHEMRTPLNAILTLLNSLEVYFENDEEAYQVFSIIKNSAKMLNYLVHDMLDLFQIKNGKLKKNPTELNPQDMVAQVVAMYSMQAHDKNLQIIVEFDQNVPQRLYLDENRCKQVLINLLTNAMKFTFKGSIKISVSYDPNDELLKISVQDSGVGISPADQQRLFKLFGKLSSTACINTNGIGLGLNICKTIVESFNGQINVTSTLGEGSTFSYTFEALKQKEQIELEFETDQQLQDVTFEQQHIDISDTSNTGIETSDIMLKGAKNYFEENLSSAYLSLDENSYLDSDLRFLHKKHLSFGKRKNEFLQKKCKLLPKILVVDDNCFNIFTLQMLLRATFEVQSDKAINGEEAINMILTREQQLNELCTCHPRCKSYEVVFMDCNMPIMDGYQASEMIYQMFKDKQLSSLPEIIALTAYESQDFEDKARVHKMSRFLTKPIHANEIKRILQEHLLILP